MTDAGAAVRGEARRRLDPLAWAAAALAALVLGMPGLAPVFGRLFPGLERPVYLQDSFLALTAAHVGLVAVSSGAAVIVGAAAGLFVTRAAGREFRGLVQSLVSMGQTVPPVAVLAVAVPVIGFGSGPALIALFLYGLLPITESTIAAIDAVPRATVDAAEGLGMTASERLRRVELPLAAPVILAGIRTSVVINIGTAAVASTVGAKTLGLPIIVGLNGFNTAYVLQGAMVVALLAVVTDLAFDRVQRRIEAWKTA